MKAPIKIAILLSAWLLTVELISSHAQSDSSMKEVTKAIQQYYQAMATRNVETLRDVLDSTFIVVEAGREHAKVHVLRADETSKLLPPVGNDDWLNLQLIDVRVSLSGTHPSVATASYSVLHPLNPDQLKALEGALKASAPPLNESQRQEISQRLANRARRESECAMLAFRDGRWRIVSISVPK